MSTMLLLAVSLYARMNRFSLYLRHTLSKGKTMPGNSSSLPFEQVKENLVHQLVQCTGFSRLRPFRNHKFTQLLSPFFTYVYAVPKFPFYSQFTKMLWTFASPAITHLSAYRRVFRVYSQEFIPGAIIAI